MRPASYPYSSYDPRASLRSRAVAFVLAVAITALIIFMLIELGAFSPPDKPDEPMVMLSMSPGVGAQPTKAKSAAKTKSVRTGGAPPSHAVAAAPDIKPPPVPPPKPPWTVMYMSKDQLASADIANLPTHHGESGAGGQGVQGTGSGHASGDDEGAGDGPGGEKLYNAEWYTRPTHAEMAFYLPKSGPREGWGIIACRTVANYGVEDCQELGESPGSGLARAVRQAAWQFKVRPPRVNGAPQIGAWVKIRFDFSERYAPDGSAAGGG